MKIRTDLYQAPLQDFIKPILKETLQALQKILPQIHSIYLYGSAAKGSAIQRKSDLDLTIILNNPISENQSVQLSELQTILQIQYPEITKVDFDFGQFNEVISQEELHRWGYWLKHCCRHLQGDNLQQNFPAFKASHIIAQALNQNYPQAVLLDLEKLQQSKHPHSISESAILKNQICKRLIRASNITRPINASEWPYELADYQLLFQKWHPEYQEELHYFYQLLQSDSFSIEALKNRSIKFIKTLDTLSHERIETL